MKGNRRRTPREPRRGARESVHQRHMEAARRSFDAAVIAGVAAVRAEHVSRMISRLFRAGLDSAEVIRWRDAVADAVDDGVARKREREAEGRERVRLRDLSDVEERWKELMIGKSFANPPTVPRS